jgi:hypothetical protein
MFNLSSSGFNRSVISGKPWPYLAFMIIGSILPWFFLLQFVQVAGLSLGEFFRQAFANPVTIALTVDLLISSVVFFYWIWLELPRVGLSRRWWGVCVLATLSIGLSCGLPLFLYLRQRQQISIQPQSSSY